MTIDERGLVDFKRCLVAAVIRCFQSPHRRTIVQLCQAFHAHWNFPPPGFDLEFVQLKEGWFSEDIRTALFELEGRNWVELTEGESTVMLRHFFDVKCMADIYAAWPSISEHIQWIMMTAIEIEEDLKAMPDPYAPAP